MTTKVMRGGWSGRTWIVVVLVLSVGCGGDAPVGGSERADADRGEPRVVQGMKLVEGGSFRMGTDSTDLEAVRVATGLSTVSLLLVEIPSHEVRLGDFYMDSVDVTNSAFATFVTERPAWSRSQVDPATHNGRYLEHWFPTGPPDDLLDHPVTFVTWFAAAAFCEWSGKRLPTEAEYEWAATSPGEVGEYPWGDAPPSDNLVSWGGNGLDRTVPVASYPPNGRGLYDMSGNVWHFTADPWVGAHAERMAATGPVPSPEDVEGRWVVKGGSWGANAANLRIRYRDSHRAFDAREMVGFRCARSVGTAR